MKKTLILVSLFTLLFSTSVYAHVNNEETLYDDIEFSQAKEQIVYLRGINAIPSEEGAKLFRPQELLTKADLAFWTASFHGLAGEDAIIEDLQKAAVENGLIGSLESNATYADVNQAYFDGKASVDQPESELTREEFALFMGPYLKDEKVDGKTLFDRAGIEEGPVGVIEKATMTEEGEGEQKTKVYTLTIGGKDYQVSGHPKMMYGPTDLTQWEGKKIRDSWLINHDGEKMFQMIALEKGQFLNQGGTEANDQTSQPSQNGVQADNQSTDDADSEQSEKEFPVVPVVGAIILVIIAAWLFTKKKK